MEEKIQSIILILVISFFITTFFVVIREIYCTKTNCEYGKYDHYVVKNYEQHRT